MHHRPSDSEVETTLAALRGMGGDGARAVDLILALQERLDALLPPGADDRQTAGHLAKVAGDYLDAALGLRSSPRD